MSLREFSLYYKKIYALLCAGFLTLSKQLRNFQLQNKWLVRCKKRTVSYFAILEPSQLNNSLVCIKFFE